ncbi:recombinase family protein, partial [bacterium]|nr:recombinase family protein [bacterium]
MDKKGVVFHYINEKLDTGSAMGKFFITMLAALAELERNVVSERTKDALQNKKVQGFRVGNLPFGWALGGVDQKLIKNKDEQVILKKMKSLKNRGLSFQKIADSLNIKGLSTRRGGQFKKQNVHQTLKNSIKHKVLDKLCL